MHSNIRRYLTAEVSIDSLAEGAKIGPSFTVTGNASCEAFEDRPSEPGISLGDATSAITGVKVRVGDDPQPLQTATPMGSGNTPWASWSCAVNTALRGSQTITAFVSATRSGFEAGSDHRDRHVVIDITPPTLTINPPADVTSSTPPYTATISGTAIDDATGVAAVEWRLGDSGDFQTATGTTTWSAAVALPGLGNFTVAVRARDIAGNVSAAQQVAVRVIDVTPPSLSINSPKDTDPPFPLTAASVTIPIRGSASDTQTGVALVEWALDSQTQFKPATPKAANDWSTWSAQIPITTLGNHTISVRASDKVTPTGNSSMRLVHVAVAEPFHFSRALSNSST